MNLHEQLRENYEDALFELLMEGVIEHEGKQIREEMEQLDNNPDFSVPPELDRRCLRAINRTQRKKRARITVKKIYRVFSKLSVAAVIALALFTSAYAAFPAVRVSTLNLLIQVSDIATELTFGDADDANNKANSVEMPSDSVSEGSMAIFGYVLPESITSGHRLVREISDELSVTSMYEGVDGSIILISVQSGASSINNVNTENALQTKYLNDNGYQGIIAEQEDSVTASIADMGKTNFISFQFEGVNFNSSVELINEFITMN